MVWFVWKELVLECAVVEEDTTEELHVVRDNRLPEVDLESS